VEPRYRLGNIHDKKLTDLVVMPQQREFGPITGQPGGRSLP
jgi:hypothetical protein